ncbi:MAG TPA: C40 family peptidase [Jatrophihabitans sp.]
MRKTPRAIRALICVFAIGATLFVAAPVAGAKPPPNPTNGQLRAAAQAKNDTAAMVGRLSAQLAAAQAAVLRLQAKAEMAQQVYALALSKLQDAKLASAAAKDAVAAAERKLNAAHVSLKNFVRDSYLSPALNGTAGSLLTAPDPNSLLEQGDYLRFVTTRRLDATSQLDEATVAMSNADAAAKAAVILQQKLTLAADNALQLAKAAYAAEQQQAATLQQQEVTYQAQLQAAQLKLATLNGMRDTWNRYQARQRAIAREKARQAEARRQAALQAQLAAMRNNNNGGGGGGGPVHTGGPCGGSPGQRAVCFAEQYLGTPYAWAGGGNNGPSGGTCDASNGAPNDCNVSGFDCSGLVMYGWYQAAGLSMSHYAASQYSEAGNFHPGWGNFQPGDLLFWGLPGQSSIHHVAMYIGGGNVIQAPNSGSVVQITPMGDVSGDYFGATRPLS